MTYFQALEKPPLYTKTKGEFWNDSYISQQMLKAHLDPEFEGASQSWNLLKARPPGSKSLSHRQSFLRCLTLDAARGCIRKDFPGRAIE